jgi:hypothetical protein
MRGSEAYPVSLVGNFGDAVRQHKQRAQAVGPAASTDMMILRALLAHPLVDQAREHSGETSATLAPRDPVN